jgi:hypothetical protein
VTTILVELESAELQFGDGTVGTEIAAILVLDMNYDGLEPDQMQWTEGQCYIFEVVNPYGDEVPYEAFVEPLSCSLGTGTVAC